MTGGETYFIFGDKIRLSEVSSDAYPDTYYQALIDDLHDLFNNEGEAKVLELLEGSIQLHSKDEAVDGEQFSDFNAFDRIKAVRAEVTKPNERYEQIWDVFAYLETDEGKGIEGEDFHQEISEALMGSTNSFGFNFKAQIKAGVFYQSARPYNTVDTEEKLAKRIQKELIEYAGSESPVVDFNKRTVSFLIYDEVPFVKTFDEIKANTYNIGELEAALEEAEDEQLYIS